MMNHASQPKFDVLLQILLDLADIEARIKAGHSLRDIAFDLGVNVNTIQNRRRGKNRAFQKGERNRTLRSLPRDWLLLLEQETNNMVTLEVAEAVETSLQFFQREFKALRGYNPYPYQEQQFSSVLNGRPAELVYIPTGGGKTEIIAVWLLAVRCTRSKPQEQCRSLAVFTTQWIAALWWIRPNWLRLTCWRRSTATIDGSVFYPHKLRLHSPWWSLYFVGSA
jgi:hypothetical protein